MRMYRKEREKLADLDPEEPQDRALLQKNIENANFWKKTIFGLLEDKILTPVEVQAEMVAQNYRKEIAVDTVVRTLETLRDKGYVRELSTDPAQPAAERLYRWNDFAQLGAGESSTPPGSNGETDAKSNPEKNPEDQPAPGV